jgi:2-phosphosulfolactate phosphatase
MVTALANGAKEVRVFDSLDAARTAASGVADPKLLAGEEHTVRPQGFDLGNSPGDFTADRCRDRVIFMSTTNGTRALVAAQSAPVIFAAALLNVSVTARAVWKEGRDVTLLCSGTQGAFSLEDALGAGAVIDSAIQIVEAAPLRDAANLALDAWKTARNDLPATLRRGQGGHNIIAAGLEPDIDFAARLDVFDIVARVHADPLRVERDARDA